MPRSAMTILAGSTLAFFSGGEYTNIPDRLLLPYSIMQEYQTFQDSIDVFHDNYIDLTQDGVVERLIVIAKGREWTDLHIRFEIRSNSDSLLFAHEWNSGAWFGNIYYAKSDADAEKRGREYVANVVASSRVAPGLPGSSRLDTRRRSMRWAVRWDIAEQFWKNTYDIPLHEHLVMRSDGREIVEEFGSMISDDQIEKLIDDCIEGPSYRLHPHWDATYGIVWSRSEHRFVIAVFIG